MLSAISYTVKCIELNHNKLLPTDYLSVCLLVSTKAKY